MGKIKKFSEEEISFSAKSLEKDKKPSFKTSLDDQGKIEKEFKKELDKVQKFESFVDENIEDIVDDKEFDARLEEGSGCGCCDNCSGTGCDCGCENCKCKSNDIESEEGSDDLNYHLSKGIPVTESIFRPGSKKFFNLIKEARRLDESSRVELNQIDKELFESTEIGKFAYFNEELIPLDLPMENIIDINEAEYHGKEVKLNHPMRGGAKKYYVYVKNPKTGKVKKISFGDVHGGLTAKVSNPEARKSFAARHKCHLKKDKTKAGFWSCRINRYPHLWNNKSYPGFW